MKKKLVIILVISIVLIIVAVAMFLIFNNKKDDYMVISLHEIMNEDFTVTEKIKNLEGKKVAITGFIAVQSPVSEEFAYLVSMPYVSCPYCSPDTNMLMSVMPIMSSNKVSKIHYTSNSVIVKGTLEIEDKTDEFGYSSPYRIICDSVEVYDKENYPVKMQEYIKVSSSGNIDAVTYYMYNFYYMLYDKVNNVADSTIEKMDIVSMNKAINKIKAYNFESMKEILEVFNSANMLIKEFNKEDITAISDEKQKYYMNSMYEYMQKYFEWSKTISST